MVSSDFVRQLEGYSLTTANILYRLPDYPKILQEYVWQNYDLAPQFPELTRFLEFWRKSLDGRLHSVRIAQQRMFSPREVRTVQSEFSLH